MMNYFFTASGLTWYAASDKPAADAAGTWPADAVGYPDSVYHETVTHRPANKTLGADANGYPVLQDPPGPTEAELQAVKDTQTVSARQARQALIIMGKDDDVAQTIAVIADVTERKMVNAWYEYSNEWVYGNATLTQFAAVMSIDKDEFFALAQSL